MANLSNEDQGQSGSKAFVVMLTPHGEETEIELIYADDWQQAVLRTESNPFVDWNGEPDASLLKGTYDAAVCDAFDMDHALAVLELYVDSQSRIRSRTID